MPFSLCGEKQIRGSLVIHSVSGQVELSELGQGSAAIASKDVPISIGGLLNCRMDEGASAIFSASNRMFFSFVGPGSFSLERFDQTLPSQEQWEATNLEVGQSRMIYNLREGTIILDSRNMAAASQFIIETPLGSLTFNQALLSLEVEYDLGSGLYGFVIACSSGSLRFTSNQRELFPLSSGQRLAGKGSRLSPSIEVAEVTAEWSVGMRERIDSFDLFAETAGLLKSYQADFYINDHSKAFVAEVPVRVPSSGRLPIVIERPSSPSLVSPFRGEIPRPSANQTEIF